LVRLAGPGCTPGLLRPTHSCACGRDGCTRAPSCRPQTFLNGGAESLTDDASWCHVGETPVVPRGLGGSPAIQNSRSRCHQSRPGRRRRRHFASVDGAIDRFGAGAHEWLSLYPVGSGHDPDRSCGPRDGQWPRDVHHARGSRDQQRGSLTAELVAPLPSVDPRDESRMDIFAATLRDTKGCTALNQLMRDPPRVYASTEQLSVE